MDHSIEIIHVPNNTNTINKYQLITRELNKINNIFINPEENDLIPVRNYLEISQFYELPEEDRTYIIKNSGGYDSININFCSLLNNENNELIDIVNSLYKTSATDSVVFNADEITDRCNGFLNKNSISKYFCKIADASNYVILKKNALERMVNIKTNCLRQENIKKDLIIYLNKCIIERENILVAKEAIDLIKSGILFNQEKRHRAINSLISNVVFYKNYKMRNPFYLEMDNYIKSRFAENIKYIKYLELNTWKSIRFFIDNYIQPYTSRWYFNVLMRDGSITTPKRFAQIVSRNKYKRIKLKQAVSDKKVINEHKKKYLKLIDQKVLSFYHALVSYERPVIYTLKKKSRAIKSMSFYDNHGIIDGLKQTMDAIDKLITSKIVVVITDGSRFIPIPLANVNTPFITKVLLTNDSSINDIKHTWHKEYEGKKWRIINVPFETLIEAKEKNLFSEYTLEDPFFNYVLGSPLKLDINRIIDFIESDKGNPATISKALLHPILYLPQGFLKEKIKNGDILYSDEKIQVMKTPWKTIKDHKSNLIVPYALLPISKDPNNPIYSLMPKDINHIGGVLEYKKITTFFPLYSGVMTPKGINKILDLPNEDDISDIIMDFDEKYLDLSGKYIETESIDDGKHENI